MTTTHTPQTPQTPHTWVGDLAGALLQPPLPLRVTAYDGTDLGPSDARVTIHIASEAGLRYLLTAPGDLGFARAYLTGQVQLTGVHPGDPYEAFRLVKAGLRTRRPTVREGVELARQLRVRSFSAPPKPSLENPPRWRRAVTAKLGWMDRSAAAISHHYDVSNRFYEHVLGPSMAYTCAVYADPSDTLEAAQERKFALVAAKLGLRPGMRLLDVGCGWGGMVRYAARVHGVTALGVTLSKAQAEWAQEAIDREGLSGLAQVRHLDYRDAPEREFDAVSSIGLTEHIGAAHYPEYFGHLAARLRPGGRLLNHCITRADGRSTVRPEPFTDRYVFPDGEIAPPSRIIGALLNSGLEMQHEENLRIHYAHTLAAWGRNLVENWDVCVEEAGEETSRVWGLYMAGSRFAFESNWLQLHQVLATKPGADGEPGFPLRPDWDPIPT